MSIDWDYFIKATDTERCLMFPDGGNEHLPEFIQQVIWEGRYTNPKLAEIRLIEDYKKIPFLLKKAENVCIFDSHRHIYDVIKENTAPDEEFMVYNIDFHHDQFFLQTSKQPVNCGNWVNKLQEIRPNMKYTWIRRTDSQLQGETATNNTNIDNNNNNNIIIESFNDLFNLDFVYGYFCRSGMWSPPHLDEEFVDMIFATALIRNMNSISCYEGAEKPRLYSFNPQI